jgi:hypothetical protein
MESGAHIVRREGRKIKHNRAKTIIGENLLGRRIYILSLYPNFFGYSLGGYSHWERWPRTRQKGSFEEEFNRKKKKKLEPMINYKYPSIASGATYIRSTGCAPNDNGTTQ